MASPVPRKVPYFALNVASAFASLTHEEKLYAHHFLAASWSGASICSAQCSHRSIAIIRSFIQLFSSNTVDDLRAAAGVSDDEFNLFVEYCAYAYSNLGEYLSFGDSKFIPACTRATFEAVYSRAPKPVPIEADLLDFIFSLEPAEFGFPPNGASAYYSADVTAEEAADVDAFLISKNISAYNTRVIKRGPGAFAVRVAAAVEKSESHVWKLADGVRQIDITIEFGDHKQQMARIVAALTQAREHAANDTQRAMLTSYIRHFEQGDVNDHKQSQREWIKDIGPVVETNIGFIESYRDPRGVRGEWEGFVSIVDKAQSAAYGQLVAQAVTFIAELPWGTAFEKETFLRPDFTALDVLGFASSGLPAGINIPNYDDIRQELGFKNVYLSNVVAAMSFKDKINHVTDADWEVYKAHFFVAMQVGVGIHELLGHGTGKLLCQREDGTFNFDPTLVNPLTGRPIESFYKPGETWGSVFGDISNAWEECRAEAVALYLCVNEQLLGIFGQTTQAAIDGTIHLIWLNMVRAGALGLEFYSPDTKQWRQAHMRARFCILQTLLRAPNPIVRLTFDAATDALTVEIDAARIKTDGRAAIGELLRHLNIHKATADYAAGSKYFEDLTAVDDFFLQVRATVVKLRKPRRQFVQPHTRLASDGTVQLLEFDSSPVGALQAMVTRHADIPFYYWGIRQYVAWWSNE